MKNRGGSKVTISIISVLLLIAVLTTVVVSGFGLLDEDDGIRYDKERKGILTNIEVIDGGTGTTMVGKTLTSYEKPDTYIVHFDSAFKYEVEEHVANSLEKGKVYYYRPEVNGSRILIDLNK